VTRRLPATLVLTAALFAACGGGTAKADSKVDKAATDKGVAAFKKAVQKESFKSGSGASDSTDATDSTDNTDATDNTDNTDATDSTDLSFSGDCDKFNAVFNGGGDPGRSAQSKSGDFTKGTFVQATDKQETVSAEADVQKTSKDAEDKFKLLKDSKLTGCLDQALTDSVKKGNKDLKVSLDVSRKDPDKLGDDQIGFLISGTLTAGATKVKLTETLFAARKGRAVALLSDQTLGDTTAKADLNADLKAVLDAETGK
jgi:hypothetical protein